MRTNHLLSGGKVEVKKLRLCPIKMIPLCVPAVPPLNSKTLTAGGEVLSTPDSHRDVLLKFSLFWNFATPHHTQCAMVILTKTTDCFCIPNFSCISVELKVRQGATEIQQPIPPADHQPGVLQHPLSTHDPWFVQGRLSTSYRHPQRHQLNLDG